VAATSQHPMPRRSGAFALLLAMLLLGLGACGSDGTGPETRTPTTLTVSPTTVTLDFLGATTTLVAVILDQNSVPITGTVSWTSANPSVATVNAGGTVTAESIGTTTVTATSGSLSATASVTVRQVTASFQVVSGDGQSATVGNALAQAIVVQANDAGGSPVQGAALSFSTTSGQVSPTTATTDAQGQASLSWTLGTVSGPQQIQVSVQGSSASGRVNATALAGPPTDFVKVAGDVQSGPVGQPLANPVVVKLQDEHGNGVAGGTVTFTVTSGGGTVSPSTVSTGADGTAATTWTMGPNVAGAGLEASTAGFAPLAFTASSLAAQPDLVAGGITVSPSAPTTLDTVTVTVALSNQGSASTGSAFEVRLLVDGAEAASQMAGPLAVGASLAVQFALDPLEAGSRTLTAQVDAQGSVVEGEEGNNTSQRFLTVALQTKLEVGVPIPNVGATQGVELLFAFELPAEDGSIAFRLSGGTGDADMYVNRGFRPASRDDYECISGAADSNEECLINAALPGTYHVLIHAYTAFSGTTLQVVTGLEVLPFNIDLQFIHHGSASQDQAFVGAANRWQLILPYDIRDIPFENQPVDANACIEGQPRIDDTVDDVRIYVDIITIDGPGGTLGQAGPCYIRTAGGLPIIGIMQFDIEDVTNLETAGRLVAVVLHEMGHVLGFGTTWQRAGLLKEPSIGNVGADTHFSGPLAIEAFDAAGGKLYTSGAKVPVENSGDEGSADAHWRESVMGTELMTPFLSVTENPLSAITIQSLADVGYRVDVNYADAWNDVVSAPPRVAAQREELIDLTGDIRRGPIMVVDATGRLLRVIRR